MAGTDKTLMAPPIMREKFLNIGLYSPKCERLVICCDMLHGYCVLFIFCFRNLYEIFKIARYAIRISKKELDYMDKDLKQINFCKNAQMAKQCVTEHPAQLGLWSAGAEWGWQIHDFKNGHWHFAPLHRGSIEFDGHPWKRNDLEHRNKDPVLYIIV